MRVVFTLCRHCICHMGWFRRESETPKNRDWLLVATWLRVRLSPRYLTQVTIAQCRWPYYLLLSRGHKTDLLECDDDGLSFTQEYIILYLRNIADSQIFWRTPKYSNLGALLTPIKSGSKSTPVSWFNMNERCIFSVWNSPKNELAQIWKGPEDWTRPVKFDTGLLKEQWYFCWPPGTWLEYTGPSGQSIGGRGGWGCPPHFFLGRRQHEYISNTHLGSLTEYLACGPWLHALGRHW